MTTRGYRLEIQALYPGRGWRFVFQNVQASSRAYPAFYSIDDLGFFPGGKADEA
jgi:hypothetical protein